MTDAEFLPGAIALINRGSLRAFYSLREKDTRDPELIKQANRRFRGDAQTTWALFGWYPAKKHKPRCHCFTHEYTGQFRHNKSSLAAVAVRATALKGI